jgi:hypothetical protein
MYYNSMLKNKNYIVIGIIALVLAVGIAGVKAADNRNINDLIELAKVVNESNSDVIVGAINFLNEGMLGASGTRFPHGISADTTSPLEGEVRGTTLTITGATDLGILTQGGGILATSTSGTATTLAEATLLAYNGVTMIPNVAAFTYTLPATSTLTTLLPNAGDNRKWILQNATTTVATTITLAKGAGWNLTGVDADVDVIAGAAWGSNVYMGIDCTRQEDTDIVCLLTENIAAD